MEDFPAPGMPTSTTLPFGRRGDAVEAVSGWARLRDTVGEGSTATHPREGTHFSAMFRRPLLTLLLLLIVVGALGLLALGAFPPAVNTVPVERSLPNDRFQVR